MLAKKVFITSILVGASFVLCPMSVLSVGATSQGEGTPSISQHNGIIEKPGLYLSLQKGFLSVDIDNARLEDVLKAIARQRGFKRLKVQGNAALVNKISIRFQNLPLDQGIQRILRGRSYSLIYAQPKWDRGKAISTTLEEVRIFGVGKGEQSFGFDSLEGKGSVPRTTLKGLIQQALYGEDAMTRVKAIVALAETGDSAAIAAIEQALLEDAEQDVRETALEALVHLGPDHAVGPLARALAGEKSAGFREEIIQALAWLKDERAIEPLARVLREDDDSELRESALVAMMQLGGDKVIDPLASAIKNKDSNVRELAFFALAEVGGVRAREAIQHALEHEDKDIREMMTQLLGQMQSNDEI